MMYLFVIGSVSVIALAVIAILAFRIRRRRKYASANTLADERAAEIRQWAEMILALGNDVNALIESDPMPHISSPGNYLVKRYPWCLNTKAKSLAWRAVEQRRDAFDAKYDDIPEVERRLGQVSRESGLFNSLQYLLSKSVLVRKYAEQTLGISHDGMLQELQELVDTQTDDWVDAARRGDAEAFGKLVGFYKGSSCGRSARDYRKVGLHFSYLSDWDDLVVRFYESPSVYHFAGLEPNQPTGYWRLRAAEVLRSRGSLADALKVLAVADQRTGDGHVWRDEIGDRLLSDLAKYVRQLRTEQSDTHII